MKHRLLVLAFVLASVSACKAGDDNPACAGFDAVHSDAQAIAVADQVMQQLGGRKAWDDTHCIAWNFFGKRSHVWDKCTGDYRLDEEREDPATKKSLGNRVVLMNLQSKQGRVFENGKEVEDGETKRKQLARAYSIWINDMYWLCMPYKLKDSGVTLKYKGEDKLPDGRPADVLVLTFADVGDTPENKYEVFVSKDRHMVEQWSYFSRRDDEKPAFSTPWSDWKTYGKIQLASSRGEGKTMSDIAVFDTPPAKLKAP